MQTGDKVTVVNYPPGPDRDLVLGKSGVVRHISHGRYISVTVTGDKIPNRIFFQDELKLAATAVPKPALESLRVFIDPSEAQSTAVALGLKLGKVSLNDVLYSFAVIHGVGIDKIEIEPNKVFVGAAWRKTAKAVKSIRKTARGRKVSIWQYKPYAKASEPDKQRAYRVEVRFPPELKWYPSSNQSVRGKVFGTFEDADKAAKQEQKELKLIDGYEYRAAEIV